MTMRRRKVWLESAVPVLLAALLLAAPARAQAPQRAGAPEGEAFSFYGLRFGMTAEQVQELFPANAAATEILRPGHGMVSLVLTYDYLGRLSEIRAGWERPADRLQETALRAALREKFLQPIGARWRTVSADVDEMWNRAALTLVMVSGDLRQEAIDHFKEGYLKSME
jgi:hypothetical protein